ncbi:metal-sensitive transcriptional regulator [Streptomyces sp. NPDC018833]|uniref:metal-sensitive transcriptional regulator n=1 Tax=Streptomyces sp. NPDC018833 TaxID=3365053 RepID=UPI0037AC0108
MVDDEHYCIDVLTQIGAVTRALQEIGLGLSGDHVRHCVTQTARSDPGPWPRRSSMNSPSLCAARCGCDPSGRRPRRRCRTA